MTKNFTIARYKVTIEAGGQGLSLPPYKGSTLRGGFGSAFKRISCSLRNNECRACLLRTSCPYAYIFETAPPPGAEALRNFESIPRPFVLEPPLENKTEYAPGEELAFNLVLVGKAINYLPYFIVAFRELGEIGTGRKRKKYRLAELRAVNPVNGESEVVYHDGDRLVRNVDLALRCDIKHALGETFTENSFSYFDEAACSTGNSGKIAGIRRVSLEFQTMTRIKFEDNYVRRIEFHMLIRALLRRLSSLAYFHHGWELDLDFTGLIERAAKVKLVEDDTRWVDWERYSSRQDNKMNLGGVLGRVVYEGDLDGFMPLLRLGELVHVGKGAVFGMGKYRVLRHVCERGWISEPR
ncbi:MAG: CRISPR system precrRNA processing endoribonuclease RAMP protein Cas6 [Firmicutes bacterium]|nr:CRISPR system precrRNA processing endoribonuclease RAMP protein Cas6 [Bacillota bacterium]